MRRNRQSPRPSSLLAALLIGCGGERSPHPPPSAGPPGGRGVEPATPKDSLVLRAPGGIELWYTLAREDQDSGGRACLERVVEIRAGGRRIPVPLLYTRDVPRMVNESTVSARIWLRCAPGDEYRINLRTGQPVRASR